MERPILFSTEMVRAILEGRKTQTRRVIKPQPPEGVDLLYGPEWYPPAIIDSNGDLQEGKPIYGVYDDYGEFGTKCPWQPGDILWVRETWCKHTDMNDNAFENDLVPGYYYKADAHKSWVNDLEVVKWRPSIYMPREAARIFLHVKNVRVGRLQDITEKDAMAEGVKGIPRSRELYPIDDYIYPFKQLWDSINVKRGYGWEVNPWVWVIEFEKI